MSNLTDGTEMCIVVSDMLISPGGVAPNKRSRAGTLGPSAPLYRVGFLRNSGQAELLSPMALVSAALELPVALGLVLFMSGKTNSSVGKATGLTLVEARALGIPRAVWETWPLCGDGRRCPSARWLADATHAVLNRRKGSLSISQLRRLTKKLGR
jgi:hypothetical protein